MVLVGVDDDADDVVVVVDDDDIIVDDDDADDDDGDAFSTISSFDTTKDDIFLMIYSYTRARMV